MQQRFKQWAMRILAGKDQFFEHSFIQQIFQGLSHILEMLPSFILDATLGMATLISAETITASVARQRMEEVVSFVEFSKTKIEDAGAMAID